jgi:hypothetical protein
MNKGKHTQLFSAVYSRLPSFSAHSRENQEKKKKPKPNEQWF